jgi:hypothetical protein
LLDSIEVEQPSLNSVLHPLIAHHEQWFQLFHTWFKQCESDPKMKIASNLDASQDIRDITAALGGAVGD